MPAWLNPDSSCLEVEVEVDKFISDGYKPGINLRRCAQAIEAKKTEGAIGVAVFIRLFATRRPNAVCNQKVSA
ncbi:MAG: hypothetical protein ACI8WM_002248 [Burkholderiaceae bacterium]|jgi:hypothetical protein